MKSNLSTAVLLACAAAANEQLVNSYKPSPFRYSDTHTDKRPAAEAKRKRRAQRNLTTLKAREVEK